MISIQQEICSFSKKLIDQGLNHAATGNISVREENFFYITPSGIPGDLLTSKDIVKCKIGINEKEISEMSLKPSSEWQFHQDIYFNRDDVQAIIHTHSCYASAVSALRDSIPSFNYMVALFGGKTINCSDYELFGTKQLSNKILKALGSQKGCLIANHGSVVVSEDLENAFYLSQELEHLAKQYLELKKIGEYTLLTDLQMDDVLSKFSNYGPKKF